MSNELLSVKNRVVTRNSMLAAFVSIFAYTFRDQIAEIISLSCKRIIYKVYSQVIINKEDSPKGTFAIKEEILKQNPNIQVMRDNAVEPVYEIADGYYSLKYNGKYIHILLTNEHITLFSLLQNISLIKNFISAINREYCSPQKLMIIYGSEGDSWSRPVFRRHREYQVILNKCTPSMKKVLEDINNFLQIENEQLYQSKGIPYKKGYLLSGAPGTGKTTIIELAAMIHGMQIYSINFNADKMTDATLINMISQVPPRSIIVIEEIEKQIVTLNTNNNNKISTGGILSALDGPQRLSDGTIILITLNDLDLLNIDFRNILLRKGRIDEHFILNERFE